MRADLNPFKPRDLPLSGAVDVRSMKTTTTKG
jgi:hypothetical protein